jgi:hypothetical protein
MAKKRTSAHCFEPGRSGNPKGRPKGSRNKLSEAFLAALYEDWEQHGVDVIETVRREKPDVYLKVIASILPKELNVSHNVIGDLSDEELETAIDGLKAGISQHSPTKVRH